MKLSRRESLRWIGAGTLAGAIGGVGPSAARAQNAPAAPNTAATENLQGAGFYRFMVGGAEVIVASDGTFAMSPLTGLLGANVGEAAVTGAMLAEAITDKDALGHVNTVLIKAYPHNILLDTGCGPVFGEGTGHFLTHLARAGVAPEEITDVVLTHLHPDHVGGLLGEKGLALLPKATYHLHKAEQDFWSADAPDLSRSGAPQEMRTQVTAAAKRVLELLRGKVNLIEDGAKIGDATIVHLPGHTPGHVGLHYQNGFESLLHITDAVHFPLLQLDHPDWFASFDTDREQAVQTRKAVLARAAEAKNLVTGAHLVFPGVGRLRAQPQGSGYDWRGAIWKW